VERWASAGAATAIRNNGNKRRFGMAANGLPALGLATEKAGPQRKRFALEGLRRPPSSEQPPEIKPKSLGL
jgi:hypothetical protein